MSWWRISRKWLERGSELSITTCVAISGVSCDRFVGGRVPPDRVASTNASRSSGSTRSGSGRKPDSREQRVQRGGVALGDRALAGQLELDRLARPCA